MWMEEGQPRVNHRRVDQARAAWATGVQVLTRAQADGPDPLDADSQAVMVKAEARLASSNPTLSRRSVTAIR